jgi:hypothetical protein
MFDRRDFKHTDTLEHRLSEEAKRLREQAGLLPQGVVRDATLRRARQAANGSQIIEWLRSPGSQPPR